MTRAVSDEVIAAVLEDYRAGLVIREICERHNVWSATVNKIAKNAGLRRPKTKSPRVWGPCEICGKRCRGVTSMRCIQHRGRQAEPTESDELTGGRWVPTGGILRWMSDEVAS